MKPIIRIDSSTPGPGAHVIGSKILESPGKTFAMKLEPKSAIGSGLGPSHYAPHVPKKMNHSYSIGAKLNYTDDKRNPGPGQYDAVNLNSSPNAKFTRQSRSTVDLRGGLQPGPGHYDSNNNLPNVKGAPRYGFGTSHRDTRDMAGRAGIPAPGHYGHKLFVGKEGHAKSMSAVAKYEPGMKESQNKPGPGAYSPDHNPMLKKASGWKIGSEARRDLTGDKLNESRVAPGAYDPGYHMSK